MIVFRIFIYPYATEFSDPPAICPYYETKAALSMVTMSLSSIDIL